MLPRGLYPALVTPFDNEGRVSPTNLARLLAWQESCGSKGVVLAGTNGEGASLSAVEKRDLVRMAQPVKGGLHLILGTPTSSLDEAIWLAVQAHKSGASAILASPPFFSRRAPVEGIKTWFLRLMDASPCPVILYHNPGVFGVPLPLDHLADLFGHPKCAGVKNSADDPALFGLMRGFLREDQCLLVGDETLLQVALEAGATGSISGAGNILPHWLSEIIGEWPSESAQTKFEMILPLLKLIRSRPQPETHKSYLHARGLLDTPNPRLPLLAVDGSEILAEMKARVGSV